MAEGDAAGVAAAYGINNKMSFRQISQDEDAIASIQQTLKEQGAYLESWPQVQEAVEQHWAYSGVKTLRSLALVYGGYQNDYRLEEAITAQELTEMITGLWQYHDIEGVIDFSHAPSCEDVLREAARTAGLDINTAQQSLIKANILTAQLQLYFTDLTKVPQRAEVIMLLANVHQYLQK